MRRIQCCCPARIKPAGTRPAIASSHTTSQPAGSTPAAGQKAELLTLRILQDVKLSLQDYRGVAELHTQLLSWTCARLKACR